MPHGIPRLFIKSKETSVIFDCKVTAFACHPQYSKIVKVEAKNYLSLQPEITVQPYSIELHMWS